MSLPIAPSELILNADGSVFHLHLLPEQIADNIIVVGDQGRVETVSKHFDAIECKVSNREFTTHTGTFKGKRISVLSTGIGTDNIDIVLNELDALVNIDLKTRTIKTQKKSLNIVRIGTSGALQGDIPVDSFVASSHGMGLDGLMNYYAGLDLCDEPKIANAFMKHAGWLKGLPYPYVVEASAKLLKQIAFDQIQGITATAPGFYGPQGRQLRLAPALPDLNEKLGSFTYENMRVTNFEMETSALYGLGKLLGHDCCTICAIIANRVAKEYSKDYKIPIEKLILIVLERLAV
ncbi:MAG: nucleoside phosphorylase [Bacteroidetes bacterium]|jgi:uridine phosphorylase|nr:nucleoside phosphorylase [Bacteroidota bacterium]